MGKLKHVSKLKYVIGGWLLPAILSLIVLFGIHAVAKADPAPTTSELQDYLQHNQLDVYETLSGDYPQVYYQYNHQQIQLTFDNYEHLHPVSDGQYVAWLGVINGQTQVFLYDILSDSLLQLSSVAPNEGLFLDGDQVVWQGWDGQHWQIFYYDGSQVQQITDDPYSSVHASTDGSQIIYAEQIADDDWKAQDYTIATGQTATIREGDTVSTAYPQFNSDGTISTVFVPY